MIITIQAIPERMNNVMKMIKELTNAKIHIDQNKMGSFSSFKKMLLEFTENEYRLHLQDDVYFAEGFYDYLPEIEKIMEEREIHVLSLFAPRRKYMKEQYEKGNNIVKFPNFLWLQASVFSPKFQELMREHLEFTKEIKHDDSFVAEVLKKNGIEAYVHLPSLVQHDVSIKSAMGHRNEVRRTSEIYDKNYIISYAEKLQ